ncbi:MAG: ParA family protein, partial [Polaromonas sp.]|uniref:ParA family protein n=1 Tax=Polaromonas sp. TaxID=1869339 RepID=UPI002730DF28
MSAVETVIDRSGDVLNGQEVPSRTQKFNTYAMSNFRGGIGKSTLSFNLAYEISATESTLILDLCPQRNMTQSLLGEDLNEYVTTIYDALLAEVTGTGEVDFDDLVVSVSNGNDSFKRPRKKCYSIPGSQELFLFPSLLYSQLAQFSQLAGTRGRAPSAKVLTSIKTIILNTVEKTKATKVLMDTSPFFGGATHLGWCAADALIIPVRVDQHSIDALKLTLEMLSDKTSEFHKFNDRAGIASVPKVHAVAMTHCGWSRQTKNKPDNSTRYFLQRALEIAKQHEHLFSEPKAEDCFYLMDDFLSSGRISGK